MRYILDVEVVDQSPVQPKQEMMETSDEIIAKQFSAHTLPSDEIEEALSAIKSSIKTLISTMLHNEIIRGRRD